MHNETLAVLRLIGPGWSGYIRKTADQGWLTSLLNSLPSWHGLWKWV